MRRPVNWFDEKEVAKYYRGIRQRRMRRILYEIITEIIADIGMILLFLITCTIFLIEIGG